MFKILAINWPLRLRSYSSRLYLSTEVHTNLAQWSLFIHCIASGTNRRLLLHIKILVMFLSDYCLYTTIKLLFMADLLISCSITWISPSCNNSIIKAIFVLIFIIPIYNFSLYCRYQVKTLIEINLWGFWTVIFKSSHIFPKFLLIKLIVPYNFTLGSSYNNLITEFSSKTLKRIY